MSRLFVLLALVASLALAACGQEERDPGQFQSENAQVAETEGIYVHVDELKYQVQLSKQLNPFDVVDRSYFNGLGEGARQIDEDEEWFAVFLLAQNYTDEEIRSASDFEIVDTQGRSYVPVPIPGENVWKWNPDVVAPEETNPLANDPARERFPNGGLILFKIKRESLNNRPLELVIRGQEGRAIVPLDV